MEIQNKMMMLNCALVALFVLVIGMPVSALPNGIGVFRPSSGNWYLDYNKTGVVDKAFHFGTTGDIPVVGDWDGDGIFDVGVFRSSTGNWYLATTKTGNINKTFHFGKNGDIPVVGDWDNNGITDVGVFRPSNGNWYFDTTKTGIVNMTFHFGTNGDQPVIGGWREVIPLVKAGTPFDQNVYPQNTTQSDPMTFQCDWSGNGRVYISGNQYSLSEIRADDGYTISIQPSNATFESFGRTAAFHPVLELTSGMRPGVNNFTLIIQNWQGLSMSYGSFTGIGINQTPYIIQLNE